MMANDKNRTNIYNICMDLLIKFVMLGSAGICICIKIIFPYFVDEQYALAIAIIPATIIGSMLNAIASFISTMFMTEKKTNVVMYSTLISAAVNVVFGIALRKAFGLHGATVALGVAFAALLLMRMAQAKRYFEIKFNITTIILLLGVLVIYVMEFYLVDLIIFDIAALVVLAGIVAVTFKDYILMFLSKMKREEHKPE